MTTIRPRAQVHDMPVVLHNSDNNKASCACRQHAGCVARLQQRYGLVRKRKTCRLCSTMATTIWPCAQAHDKLVASHDGNGDMALYESTRHASCVTRWQRRQGLVASAQHAGCMMATATTSAATKTTKSTSTTIPCTQAHQAFSHRAQAHELQCQT